MTRGRSVELRDQPRLGLRRLAALTLHALHFRLGRSLLTMSVVVLAIAFLLQVVGFSLVEREAFRYAREAIDRSTILVRWEQQASRALGPEAVFRDFRSSSPAVRNHVHGWVAAEIPDPDAFLAVNRQALAIHESLEALPHSLKRDLLPGPEGAWEQLLSLRQEAAFDRWLALLEREPRWRPAGSEADWESWKAQSGRWLASLESVAKARNASNRNFVDAGGWDSIQLADDRDRRRAVRQFLVGLGYPEAGFDSAFLVTALEARIAGESADGREWARFEQWVAAGRENPPVLAGLSRRSLTLLAVSTLVCLVGIANALFMSVAERYREIATLKCLGALDGSVLGLFMLEALGIGVLGGLLGALLGMALVGFRGTLEYGWEMVLHLDPATWALLFGGSVIAGSLLAALSAIIPAWQAARLAPMEAMRIE